MTDPLICCLEGPDGCGKTSVARELERGWGAVYLRCPGGTRLGELLRGPLKDPAFELGEEAMALAFAAVDVDCMRRAENLRLTGLRVVMDRCGVSNLAYRIAMRQAEGADICKVLEGWARQPSWSQVVFLEADDSTLDARIAARGGEVPDRFDSLGKKVREAYRDQEVGRGGDEIVFCDASESIEAVARRVAEVVGWGPAIPR
jgi:thymidylate kinase